MAGILSRPVPPDAVKAGGRLWRAAIRVQQGLVALLAIHLLLTLVAGGYRFHLLGVAVGGSRLELPVIALLTLLVAGPLLRRRRLALVVLAEQGAGLALALALCVYLANGAVATTGDTIPARSLPFSLLREGNFDLDELAFPRSERPPYYLERSRGHYVSSYPVGAPLLALPIYLPSALGTVVPESSFALQLEKLAAATLTALSVAVLFLTVRRLAPVGWAWAFTIAYALGSSSLSTSSQALWQHGPSQLAIASALYCLVRGRAEPRWLAFSGFPLAMAVVCRPTDILLALPVAGYVLIRHRSALLGFIASALPAAVFQLWYNVAYFGNPLRTQFAPTDGDVWSAALGQGLAGLLLSPGRGLLVYSPVFILSVAGAMLAWRRGGDALLRAVGLGVLLTVLVYGQWTNWWGGHGYGPRLLADLAPSLALLLCPLQPWLARPWPRALFVVLAAWSVLAHAAGAFWQDGRWNAAPDVNVFPARLWSWTDNPLANTASDLSGRVAAALGSRATSRSGPNLVAAALDIVPEPRRKVAPGEGITFELKAVNAGETLWLSQARRGQVMIAWRWAGERMPARAPDLIKLNHDVRPPGSYELPFRLRAPREPGTYALEVGLVTLTDGEARWIAAKPGNPLRFAVHVVADARSGIAALLDDELGAARAPAPSSPQARVAVNGSRFEPGAAVIVSLDVANPAGSPARDLSVGVLLPDRRTAMFASPTGTLTAPTPVADHRDFVRLLEMGPGFVLQAPSFFRRSIPRDAEPGTYEVFLLVTRAGALGKDRLAPGDVLALDVATFEIAP